MRIVTSEKCYVCGGLVDFIIEENAVLLREAKCNCCSASLRNSDMAKAIVHDILGKDVSLQEAREDFESVAILSTASTGPIHKVLAGLPGYVCGEYLDGIIPGHYYNGIMCMDLRQISFADNRFDLVISEDVFEHIDGVEQAFAEINRVLKNGGRHIFTVPVHEGRMTKSRKALAPVYHGDPLRSEGVLVITDFGDDVVQLVDPFGMQTTRIDAHTFYDSTQITDVDIEYLEYEQQQNDLLYFFRYNSVIFSSVKQQHYSSAATSIGVFSTGERFVPEQSDPLCISEHMQRYKAVLEFVKGKVVLDAACGEGYGSNLLASTAAAVTGVDISEEAIYNAQSKYQRENLSYIRGSIEKLPLPDASVDVVISFETIEHVTEELQEAFLREIKRVLKPNGLSIISTPEKLYYTDIPDSPNEFHVKEFYEEEFLGFLQGYFKHVDFYFQGVQSHLVITKGSAGDQSVIPVNTNGMDAPKYLIAICSDVVPQESKNISSMIPITGDCMSLLYVDYGEGFTAENKLTTVLTLKGRNFSVDFTIPVAANIRGLRWDPLEGHFCRARITQVAAEGAEITVQHSNAWRVRDDYDEFMTTDPSYHFAGEFNKITHLHIEGIIDVYDLTMVEIAHTIHAAHVQRQFETQLKSKQEQIDSLEKINHEKDERIKKIEHEKENLIKNIDDMILSKSWRCTAPLRYVGTFLRKLRNR